MKIKLLLITIFVLLFWPRSYSQWTHKFYIDNFGDKTKEEYINYLDANGSFSNTATINSDLTVRVIISFQESDTLPFIRFDLFEYNRGPAVSQAISYSNYILTIKLASNKIDTFNLCANSAEIHFCTENIEEKLAFLKYLKKESLPIKCHILINNGYTNSTYNFKINPNGFGKAFDIINRQNYKID
jgi:hypothetical protein